MIVRLLQVAAVSMVLAGCGMSADTDEAWKNVVIASGDDCPDIAGTYVVLDDPAYVMLGGPPAGPDTSWQTITLAGDAARAIEVTVHDAWTGRTNATPIRRIRGTDYTCSDGWLQAEWPYGRFPFDRAADGVPQGADAEKSMSIARNTLGELVVRTNIRTWESFSVWCGDGCASIPLPFTGSTRHQWSRWPASPRDPSPLSAGASLADDGTPEGAAARRLAPLLPPHIRLVRIVSMGDNQWNASLQGGGGSVPALQGALQTSGDLLVDNLRIDAASPLKAFVVTFRFAPTAEENAARKAQEATRREHALQREAEVSALVKRLLPSFPRGMTTTGYRLEADGFLVELRHRDERAFEELLTRAVASGEFSSADIKARKSPDPERNQVVEVLLVPTTPIRPAPKLEPLPPTAQ